MRIAKLVAVLAFLVLAAGPPALHAADLGTDALGAIVKLDVKVPSDARSAQTLGSERSGSGVVIDGSGLVLTVGYLVLEANDATIGLADGRTASAEPIAYDHESGFGLLRARRALGVKPMELGDSRKLKERDPVLVAGHGGKEMVSPAYVVSRRDFAGPWEYLLEEAVFTAPAYPNFGGAALIAADGRLVGIGSLMVPDAIRPGIAVPGNMFVPIEKLTPILADLLATGRNAGPHRPWLGLRTDEYRGRLFVEGATAGAPAAKAGLKHGDLVIGVAGKPVTGMADFYRKVWALGEAGVTVPLQVLDGVTVRDVRVISIDRYHWYRSGTTY